MTDAFDGRRAFNSRGQSETASITTVTSGSAEVAQDHMCLCACMKPACLLEYVDSFISWRRWEICRRPTLKLYNDETLGPLVSLNVAVGFSKSESINGMSETIIRLLK